MRWTSWSYQQPGLQIKWLKFLVLDGEIALNVVLGKTLNIFIVPLSTQGYKWVPVN